MRASASESPASAGTGFFGFNTVKYAATLPPATSATTTTASAMRRPQRFFGRMTCAVGSSAANACSVSTSTAMGPVSSPPMVSGKPLGSVGSMITVGIGPVFDSIFGVVRMRIGSVDAVFGTGAGISPVASFAGTAGAGTGAETSASNNPVPTTSIGVGRGIFSAACTNAVPSSRGLKRSGAVGRPARSRTCASAPKSALTGSNLPTRLANAAATVSAANGTSPVIASTSMSASE